MLLYVSGLITTAPDPDQHSLGFFVACGLLHTLIERQSSAISSLAFPKILPIVAATESYSCATIQAPTDVILSGPSGMTHVRGTLLLFCGLCEENASRAILVETKN
jgi:hypothetical protein